MGLRLIGEAFAFGTRADLSGNEFRLLLHMAYTARDTDTPPIYFARREESAFALGRMVPDSPAPDDPQREQIEAERAAAFQAVKVAVAGLVRSGAIERRTVGGKGRRAVYAMTFPDRLLS